MESMHRLAKRVLLRRSVHLATCGVTLLLTSALVAGPAGAAGVLLHPGVLVDPDRGTAFVMGAEGGLDALDLGLGQLRWRSEDAVKPLMLDRGRLLAQAEPGRDGALRLVTIDAESAAVVHQANVALPVGVRGTIDDTPLATFRTHAAGQGDQAMIVWAQTKTVAMGAVLPGPNEGKIPGDGTTNAIQAPERPAFERVEGAASVRLSTGQAQTLPKAALASGTATPSLLVELSAGERLDQPGRQFASADGRHVLASTRRDDAREVWSQYRWTILDRGTSSVIGSVDQHVSAAPFVVTDGRLVYAAQPTLVQRGEALVHEPLQLRAIDLASGVQVWNHHLRNTDFAGPFPP